MPRMAHVVVTRRLPGAALERLARSHDVEVWPGELPPSPAELAGLVANADGLLSLLTDRIDGDLLAHAPHLKAIANCAVGCDNVDLTAAAARGIAVGVTPDVLTDATADLAMALILAAARRLPQAFAAGRGGGRGPRGPAGWVGAHRHGAALAVGGAPGGASAAPRP